MYQWTHLGKNGLLVVTSWQEAGHISGPSWQEWFIIGYILEGEVGLISGHILAEMGYHWLHLGRNGLSVVTY